MLVDGVPLKRVVALAKHESDSSTLPVAADSPGEYEYLNPSQIVISFSTADTNFVGTPLITLVTPEKTAPINFFRMRINGGRRWRTLQQHSTVEPMFLDAFRVDGLEVEPRFLYNTPVGDAIRLRLHGSGFRQRAQICVNNNCDFDKELKHAGLYEFEIPKPADSVWTVTYRMGQEVGSTIFETTVDGTRPSAPTIGSIENPATGRADGLLAGGYTVIIRGENLHNVDTVNFGQNAVTGSKIKRKHPNVLLVEVPAGPEGGVQVLLEGMVRVDGQSHSVSNILDFITPGKAIFKYVKPERAAPAPAEDKKKKGKGKAAT
ncbi:MAG TPA: IPT/TIG domain-containing protein [Pyrinomonadaceae bacterium]